MARPLERWSVSMTVYTIITTTCILTSTSHADECGTRFTDPTSSTVRAQVVILGSVMQWNPSHPSDGGKSANVSVEKVYKGENIVMEARPGDDMMVMVSQFGPEDKDRCVASDSAMSSEEKHIFFLRRTHQRNRLQMSALPLAMVAQVERRVKRSLCDTCVKPPHIKKLVCKDCATEPEIKDIKSKKVVLGRRARLRCSAKGKPQPTFTWSKNGLPVTSGNGGITIRTTSRSSTLLVLKTMSVHAGEYKCIATNDIGTKEKAVTLQLSPRTRQPSYTIDTAPDRVACENNLCSNGATCLYSPTLDLSICLCPHGYEGVRCENSKTNASSDSGSTRNENPERASVTSVQGERTTQTTSGAGIQQQNLPQGHSDTKIAIVDARRITPRPQPTNSVDVQPVQQPSTSLNQPPILRPQVHQSSASVHQRPASFVPPRPQVQQSSTPVKQRPASFVPPRPQVQQSSTPVKQRPASFVPPRPQVQQSSTPVKQRPASFVPPRPQQPNRGTVLRRPISSYGKSRLKVSFCKDKSYCLNGGKCRYIPKQKFKYCQCRTGFAGKRCERQI